MSWPTDEEPRYVVREHTGYRINPLALTVGGSHKGKEPGRSVRVVDRAWAGRTIREWAVEDEPGNNQMQRADKIANMRERAAGICEELNARE